MNESMQALEQVRMDTPAENMRAEGVRRYV